MKIRAPLPCLLTALTLPAWLFLAGCGGYWQTQARDAASSHRTNATTKQTASAEGITLIQSLSFSGAHSGSSTLAAYAELQRAVVEGGVVRYSLTPRSASLFQEDTSICTIAVVPPAAGSSPFAVEIDRDPATNQLSSSDGRGSVLADIANRVLSTNTAQEGRPNRWTQPIAIPSSRGGSGGRGDFHK